MSIQTHELAVSTRGIADIHDLTPDIANLIDAQGFDSGSALIFVPGSTAGITTIEYELGLVRDIQEAVERLASSNKTYHHDARWGDGNGFSHVRAALLGPGITVPISGGRLLLGTWQQIILIDFDNRARKRTILVQLQGEFKNDNGVQ